MCGTRFLNSNSREDELIIVHYTTDDNIDFDKLFKNKGNIIFLKTATNVWKEGQVFGK